MRKYWINGWWAYTLEDAKDKAEAIGHNRISFTPTGEPDDLKLKAVYMFGRWWKNRFMVSAVE